MRESKVVLHIVTGFLGSGKTNVLLHLLGTASPEGRLGVVVGEFADEGYDGPALEDTGHAIKMVAGLQHADRALAYLPALRELVLGGYHRRVILETSGVVEAERLREALKNDEALAARSVFGRSIAVVDAAAFPKHLAHFESQMRAQVSMADILVVNKTDKVGPAELAKVRTALKGINAEAEVQFAYMGQMHRPSFWAPMPADVPPRLLRAEPLGESFADFEAFVYRTPQVAWDRVRFGHLLLNLPSRVARFKGVLRAHDKSYAVNGLPGQLDWDNRAVAGATRIAIIGVGLAADTDLVRAALDDELARQEAEMRR